MYFHWNVYTYFILTNNRGLLNKTVFYRQYGLNEEWTEPVHWSGGFHVGHNVHGGSCQRLFASWNAVCDTLYVDQGCPRCFMWANCCQSQLKVLGVESMIYYITINRDRQCKVERAWYTPYQSEDHSPTIPTYRQKEEKGKKSTRLYSRGRAAWANKKTLALLLKPASPTPSNTASARSFWRDTERGIKVLRYARFCEILPQIDDAQCHTQTLFQLEIGRRWLHGPVV